MRRRLTGLDLARLLAVAGMVVVHGWTDLVVLPLERAGATVPAAPTGPDWAVLLQALATDRARPLFVLLAGTGVSLLVRRTGAGPRHLLVRAAVLAALGVALAVLGWSDLVLLAYGVLFALAVVLVRLPSAAVAVLAVLAWSLPVGQVLVTGTVPDGGPLPVLGEFGWFFAGVVLGRLDLGRPRTAARLALAGAVGTVVGAVGLLSTGNALPGWAERDGAGALALDTALTGGMLLLTLAACLAVGRAAAGEGPGARATRALAVAGAMPLTVYVAHALLWTALSGRVDVDLVGATAIGAGFLVAAVVLAQVWAHAGHPPRPRRGPLEALLHRASAGVGAPVGASRAPDGSRAR